jgi:hypothetical protein
MRLEGDWWVAYIALVGDMDGAVEIGRMKVGAIQATPNAGDRFKALCVSILEAMLTETGLTVVDWQERLAPESERAGRA